MQPNETLKPKPQPSGAPEDAWYQKTKAQMEHGANEPGKEKKVSQGLWTSIGDVIRDMDTANKMAAYEFDGDSALMHAARGGVSMGVGAGMEKGMESLWNAVWQGKKTLVDRFEVGADTAKKLNDFALEPDQPHGWKARLAFLIKEGTEDIAIGAVYNMILGFRAQPMFPKVEAKHLLRSLSADTLEALLSPTLPQNTKWKSAEGNRDIVAAQIDVLKLKEEEYLGKQRWDRDGEKLNDYGPWLTDVKKAIEAKVLEYEAIPVVGYDDPSAVEKFLHQALNFSNPVTQLGLDMMLEGGAKLIKNFVEVRKVRKEKGGLPGKKVFMPKGEYRGGKPDFRSDRRQSSDRRQQTDRRYEDNRKDKVYYGRGDMRRQQPQPQEVDLEKFD